jgi:transposase
MVEYYLGGHLYGNTAQHFNVNKNTVFKWIKRYKEHIKVGKIQKIYYNNINYLKKF